jgi:hypothetical protein
MGPRKASPDMTRSIDTDTEDSSSNVVGFPEWIAPGLSVKTGRDPLGLQTITVDRIMPQLLPGILSLSQRARYLSFYPFLLAEYQAHKLATTNNALSTFIKAREYEYGLAVQLCPRGCGSRWSAVIGKDRVEPAVKSGADPLVLATWYICPKNRHFELLSSTAIY